MLTLQLDSRTLNLELDLNSSIVIGRGSSCDIHIDESSVSSEHLKITFLGTAIRITDLESSNGTFRLPSEAPFAEAEFPLATQTIELRLGFEESIKLSWSVKSDSKNPELTKTAFEGGGATGIHQSTPSVAASAAAPHVAATATSTVKVSAVEKIEKKVSGYFKTFALLVFSAAIFALSRYLWRGDLGFVERVDSSQRGVGLGIDILAVSLAGYSLRGWMLAALSLVLAYVFYRFWIKPIRHSKLRALICVWAIVVSVWPLVYPFVLAARNGIGVKHYQALRESQGVFDSSAFTLDEKSQKFAQLLPYLEGSSYFYSRVINLFFERVVEECGGAWKDDWSKKKLCLVLINSVSVEAVTDMKPRVLMPIALRLVLITSLDSIMRIFPVEGPASEMNAVFIKSVEAVGLKEDAATIRAILASNKTDASQKLDALQKLKNAVELRMDTLNVEYAIPDVMRVNPPDILALGI